MWPELDCGSNQGTAVANGSNNVIVRLEELLACFGYESVVVGDKNPWKVSSSNHK